tara:strand:+ start:3671 stop:4501 length:831 start_codon:yes stop_codon:yes gene_type:complete
LKNLLIALFCIASLQSLSQEISSKEYKSKKGEMFFYWGWNRSVYSKSTMHFKGEDYSFRLDKVKAYDRQTDLSLIYINPGTITIPQFNFRIGYFISNHWSISFGLDHMKYVMLQNQRSRITGNIGKSGGKYEGTYNKEEIELEYHFLRFEHTDGLNYGNIELRHQKKFHAWKYFNFSLIQGFGAGLVVPKTNSNILSKGRNDEFHLAGFGLDAILGIQMRYKRGAFIQMEAKGGFIDMYDILTSPYSEDRASQHFFFFQPNVVIGYQFGLKRKQSN